MSASYLYINTHNAAAVPYYALPWGCEETFKEICFDGVVIPNKNLKKEKEIGWSHYNVFEWQRCETHRVLFCGWWLCLCKSIEQSAVPTRLQISAGGAVG